jgi:hypothetical protein
MALMRTIHNENTRQQVLAQMMEEVTAVNVTNGWHDASRSFGEDVALLHSEVSEMLEAYRDHGTMDATEPHTDPFMKDVPNKPEGVGSEAADILIRLLDTCDRSDIDLYV